MHRLRSPASAECHNMISPTCPRLWNVATYSSGHDCLPRNGMRYSHASAFTDRLFVTVMIQTTFRTQSAGAVLGNATINEMRGRCGRGFSDGEFSSSPVFSIFQLQGRSGTTWAAGRWQVFNYILLKSRLVRATWNLPRTDFRPCLTLNSSMPSRMPPS